MKDSLMDSSGKIVALDYKNPEQVQAAAKLHQELLSDSPIPQLGYEFMTKFYYTRLVMAGLIKCDLYEHAGTYIAFSVYTKYPFTFMEEGQRRFFFYLVFLLLKRLLLNPLCLKTILRVRQMNRQRRLREYDNKTGAILSFGVVERYRHWRDEATGLRLSNLLFEQAVTYFKNEGFERVQGEIKKDNKPSLLFWNSYGALIEYPDSDSERYYLVILEL